MSHELLRAARDLLAARREDEVFDVAVTVLDDLTSADECAIALPDDGTLVSRASISTGLLAVPDESPLTDTHGIIQHSFRIGKPCVVDDLTDVRSTSQESAPAGPARYRSLLCVPVEERGVLVAVSRQPAAFSDADLDSVEQFAPLVAVTLDRLDATSSPSDHTELLEEVATILSHDVTNPLSVAYAHLEMAREDAPDDEHFDKAITALDRLEGLVDDAVELLRTGERVGSPEPVDLREVAKRAWTVIETPEAVLELGDSTSIVADESSLSQLLENLFRNAVEHGGQAVTVRIGLLDEAAGFYVEDDGRGIPPDEREDVFDYGYTSTQEQTGFGLSIVQWIVDAHGWTIAVSEGTDGGARFEIGNVDVR